MTIHALTSVAASVGDAPNAIGKRKWSASPPPTAADALRNVRRERATVMAVLLSLLRGRWRAVGQGVDRFPHARVRPATAQIGHRSVNIGIGRLGMLVQKCGGRHDHAGLAVAALRDFMLDPRLLHSVQPALR